MRYDEQLDSILLIFESSFKQEYKRLTFRKKSKLLRYLLSFYRRWYHSALIENTILTPSNIIAKLNNEYLLPGGGVPYPVLKGNNNFVFKLLNYSIDNHPVVSDLATFAEKCSPDIELTEFDTPIESVIDEIAPLLSMNDPFYVEYLCQLALHMKILYKLPSIYSNKAQLSPEYVNTETLSGREAFMRIFHASVEIATNFLVQSVPVKNKKLTTEFIMTALREPVATEELFERIYKLLGIDFDGMANFSGDIFDELYQAMISSTFFLGLLIDRYFFTVFGFYLKIINPGYTLTFDMRNELEYVADGFREMDDLSSGFFAPCSNYTITELGLELLSVTPDERNTAIFPKKISMSMLIPQILMHIRGMGSNIPKSDQIDKLEKLGVWAKSPENVHTFKINAPGIRAFWKSIEFDDKTTLEQMYKFICQQFGFDLNNKYSFFVGAEESPFFEYTSPRSKKRTKKADVQTIGALVGEKKSLLIIYNTINSLNGDIMPSKEIRIRLEHQKTKEFQFGMLLPNVCKVSAAFRELEGEYI